MWNIGAIYNYSCVFWCCFLTPCYSHGLIIHSMPLMDTTSIFSKNVSLFDPTQHLHCQLKFKRCVGNTHEREIRNGEKPQNSSSTAKLSPAHKAKKAAGSAFETESGELLTSLQFVIYCPSYTTLWCKVKLCSN